MNRYNLTALTGLILAIAITVLLAVKAFAYDATFNFTQQYPELVAGWKIKAGPTKGGPYPHVIDCKKPAANSDGSYDCIGTGLTANPIFAVAVNYDSAGKESAQSPETTMAIAVPPPAAPKIAIKVTTISKVGRRGNVTSETTVSKSEVPEGAIVKEGTTTYRNSRGEYVSNTIIVM